MINRFLMAGLHLKSVFEYNTTKQRKGAVSSLPKELNVAYKKETIRIERSGGENFETAKAAFSWIFHAKRPLLMAELREAIAISPIENIEEGDDEDCRDLDPESLTDSK